MPGKVQKSRHTGQRLLAWNIVVKFQLKSRQILAARPLANSSEFTIWRPPLRACVASVLVPPPPIEGTTGKFPKKPAQQPNQSNFDTFAAPHHMSERCDGIQCTCGFMKTSSRCINKNLRSLEKQPEPAAFCSQAKVWQTTLSPTRHHKI